jgi:hypothetical protein
MAGSCSHVVPVCTLQAAATALRLAANTEGEAGEGRLDACLRRLAQMLDSGFAPSASRLESLELLTTALQAASLLAGAEQEQQAAAAAAAGEEAMAEAHGAEPSLDTSDPLAFELSAALRSIASVLQLDAAASPTAAALAAAVQGRVAELLAQLPAGFFEPLLPPGALGDSQVGAGSCARQLRPLAHTQCSLLDCLLLQAPQPISQTSPSLCLATHLPTLPACSWPRCPKWTQPCAQSMPCGGAC